MEEDTQVMVCALPLQRRSNAQRSAATVTQRRRAVGRIFPFSRFLQPHCSPLFLSGVASLPSQYKEERSQASRQVCRAPQAGAEGSRRQGDPRTQQENRAGSAAAGGQSTVTHSVSTFFLSPSPSLCPDENLSCASYEAFVAL